MLLSSFIIERSVTDDCSSKLDQRHSQRRDKKVAFKRIKYKFRASINTNSSLCTVYWYTERVPSSELLSFTVFVMRNDSAYS